MQVKLVLRSGSQAGKTLPVPAKCLIGRSEECQVRPQLDAISRKHCLITVKANEVVVSDLGSRNGTFVNDQRITEETVVLSGDVLRVGPVAFEVLIEETVMKPKKPVVKDVMDAAKRTLGTSNSGSSQDLSDVHRWLEEEDVKEKQKRTAEPETRQFRLDDTSHTGVVASAGGSTTDASADTKVVPEPTEEEKKGEKKAFGKLPPRPTTTGNNSRDAAADMLKKFFNRR